MRVKAASRAGCVRQQAGNAYGERVTDKNQGLTPPGCKGEGQDRGVAPWQAQGEVHIKSIAWGTRGEARSKDVHHSVASGIRTGPSHGLTQGTQSASEGILDTENGEGMPYSPPPILPFLIDG